MLATPFQHTVQPGKHVNVLTPFLRHLNMGTLALILAIALAIVANIRGKLLDVRNPASSGASDRHTIPCASK
jgi:hypothetical protein